MVGILKKRPQYVAFVLVIAVLIAGLICFRKQQTLEVGVYAIFDNGDVKLLGQHGVDELKTLDIYERTYNQKIAGLAYLPIVVIDSGQSNLDGKHLYWKWQLGSVFSRPSSAVDGSYYNRGWYADYGGEKYFDYGVMSSSKRIYYCEDPLTKNGYSSCAGNFRVTTAGGNFAPIVLVFDDDWFKSNWGASGCTGSESYYVDKLGLGSSWKTITAYCTARIMDGNTCKHVEAGSVNVSIKHVGESYSFHIQWAPAPVRE